MPPEGDLPVKFSSRGVILMPDPHDGDLLHVGCVDKVLTFGVRCQPAGAEVSYRLPGVEAFVCNGFLAGNIVFEIGWHDATSEQGRVELVRSLSSLTRGVFEIYYRDLLQFKTHVVLHCSYGAEFVAAGDMRKEEFTFSSARRSR